MTGRAKTPAQKRIIMERVLVVWEKHPELRLGQLLENAVADVTPFELFYIEDERLAVTLEGWKP